MLKKYLWRSGDGTFIGQIADVYLILYCKFSEIKNKIIYWVKSCNNHDYKIVPHIWGGGDLHFCRKCGYNKELGFFAKQFRENDEPKI